MSPQPTFFASPGAFRKWLAKHHADTSELFVGFYRRTSGRGGITYPQALDEALCFGWIDGVRKNVSDDAWMIRFTPRKPKSYWSSVNIKKAEALVAQGRMAPPGLAVFQARDASGTRRYSFEQAPKALGGEWLERLKAAPKAFAFHEAQAPYYRKAVAHWILSAKKPETRERRFAQLIEHANAGHRIPPLASAPTGTPKRGR